MEINGREYTPQFTIEVLERFEQLTGQDLLFKGSEFSSIKEKKAFVLVSTGVDEQEVNGMTPKEFLKVFMEVFKAYTDMLGVSDDPGESKKK